MSDAMFNVYIQISSLSITLLSSNQYPAERKFTSTVTFNFLGKYFPVKV